MTDISLIPILKSEGWKVMSRSKLKSMKKDELIETIETLENNYGATIERANNSYSYGKREVERLEKENAELKMKLLNFENKKEWVDFSKFDFCDDMFKHFLFKLENGKVYCGYMTEDVADGDCCFGLTYFKDNMLKSESDWGFITSIDGSKITHFMRIENLGEL